MVTRWTGSAPGTARRREVWPSGSWARSYGAAGQRDQGWHVAAGRRRRCRGQFTEYASVMAGRRYRLEQAFQGLPTRRISTGIRIMTS